MAGDGDGDNAERTGGVGMRFEHGDFIFMPRTGFDSRCGRDGILRSEQVVDSIAFRAEWVKRVLHTESRDLILIEVDGDSMAPTVEDSDLILANLAEPRFRQEGFIYCGMTAGLR